MQDITLEQNKTLIEVSPKYVDYVDMFLFDLAIELSENIDINRYAFKLEEGKQLIYSLGLVELETLKIYIKTYLKIGFIQSSKSSIGTSILSEKKSNGNLYLCINYQDLNNLTIKN